MRPALYVLATLALVAVLVVGLSQAGGSDSDDSNTASSFDVNEARARLQGAPGPLADVYAHANELLDGGGFQAGLRKLEGHPVVINKWASWCHPCRAEFPIFQQVATERGKEIAFLGLNAADKRPAAERFLAERPLPYPSYEDSGEKIASELKAPKYFPMTVFVKPNGKIEFRKAGEYKSVAELEADIDRYLGA
jgi:thiol-disulfide isomerase/thioredoxin